MERFNKFSILMRDVYYDSKVSFWFIVALLSKLGGIQTVGLVIFVTHSKTVISIIYSYLALFTCLLCRFFHWFTDGYWWLIVFEINGRLCFGIKSAKTCMP